MSPSPKVGDTFTHVRACDPYRPVLYAGASTDANPVHIDPEVGRRAGHGGVILQGMCTLAWALEAVAGYLGGDPGRIRRVKVRFSRPVRPGDVVTFQGRVTAVEGGRLTAEVSATNQHGDDVLQRTLVEASL